MQASGGRRSRWIVVSNKGRKPCETFTVTGPPAKVNKAKGKEKERKDSNTCSLGARTCGARITTEPKIDMVYPYSQNMVYPYTQDFVQPYTQDMIARAPSSTYDSASTFPHPTSSSRDICCERHFVGGGGGGEVGLELGGIHPGRPCFSNTLQESSQRHQDNAAAAL
ncbi:hypothetical protein EYF80_053869 [Liparis tanakae]|uniref:Uncharacterized protein n=1 Tax=Liparis tanakae TaxID=230148 RepID=A0A4Z2F5D5_9TELE|nr:hypothetical protein EYF80_053869 [Liparis tanakae]